MFPFSSLDLMCVIRPQREGLVIHVQMFFGEDANGCNFDNEMEFYQQFHNKNIKFNKNYIKKLKLSL